MNSPVHIGLASAFGAGIGTMLAQTFGYPIYLCAIAGGLLSGMISSPKEILHSIRHPRRTLHVPEHAKKAIMKGVEFLFFLTYVLSLLFCMGTVIVILALVAQSQGFTNVGTTIVYSDTSVRELVGFITRAISVGCIQLFIGGIFTFVGMAAGAASYDCMEDEGAPLWVFPIEKLIGKHAWTIFSKNSPSEVRPIAVSWSFNRQVVARWIGWFIFLSFGAPLVLVITFGILLPILIIDAVITSCFALARTKFLASVSGGFMGTLAGCASTTLGYAHTQSGAVVTGMLAGALCGLTWYWARLETERLMKTFARRQRAHIAHIKLVSSN